MKRWHGWLLFDCSLPFVVLACSYIDRQTPIPVTACLVSAMLLAIVGAGIVLSCDT